MHLVATVLVLWGPINFLKQGPTGKSPGFPAGQSAPGIISYFIRNNPIISILVNGDCKVEVASNVPPTVRTIADTDNVLCAHRAYDTLPHFEGVFTCALYCCM